MFGKKKFSEPKKFRWWHGAIIAFIILATVIVGITSRLWPTAWIKIGEESYHVLVADTPQHQFKGLSDRANLGDYDGMLFDFGEASDHRMVMRRMRFSLDIIWLNNGEIIDMAPNLPPDEALNEAGLKVYAARLPSDMVLEFPAGFIEKHGLKVGDSVVIAR